jgi:hypothetical protein
MLPEWVGPVTRMSRSTDSQSAGCYFWTSATIRWSHLFGSYGIESAPRNAQIVLTVAQEQYEYIKRPKQSDRTVFLWR